MGWEWWIIALCIGLLLLSLPWPDPPPGGYYEDDEGYGLGLDAGKESRRNGFCNK